MRCLRIFACLCLLLCGTPIEASAVVALKRQSGNSSAISLPGLPANITSISPATVLDGITDNAAIDAEYSNLQSELANVSTTPTSNSRTLSSTQLNITTYKNYLISQCTDDQTTEIQQAIDAMIQGATAAAYEASRKGLGSRFGFGSLFTTTDSASRVSTIFQKMAKGIGIVPRIVPAGMFLARASPPNLICINDGDPQTTAIQEECTYPYMAAGQYGGSNFVWLCPHFFDFPIIPNEVWCPKTVDDEPSPNVGILQFTLATALAHELAHMYLNAYAARSLYPEVYLIADAVALAANKQAVNPSNYAFFLGATLANCVDWPVSS